MTSQARDYATGGQPVRLNSNPLRPTQIDLEAQDPRASTESNDNRSPVSPTNSFRIRKVARSNTAKTYRPDRRGQEWLPGQEPGIDVSSTSNGRPRAALLEVHEECEITVVDFSQDEMQLHHLDNYNLGSFLANPRPVWSECRWINVNGLSWDVIETLGKDKYLHRLAIEDLMNPRNRTKADWYTDHTYIVLPLQKLVHFHANSECDSECSQDAQNADNLPADAGRRKKQNRVKRRWWPFERKGVKSMRSQQPEPVEIEKVNDSNGSATSGMPSKVHGHSTKTRTLQRYLGGPNEERIEFMEKHSALTPKGLAVGVEQVSIFLTSDNTVISFFESSAEDIETPLIKRLSTPETILRRCSDASMITQAIIDAIIDLAIPVAAAYQDVAGEVELNVLTEADVRHTTALYVLTSEIVLFRSNIAPIVNLVNALRDHKSESIGTPGLTGKPPKLSSGVTISSTAQIYFRDIEDHCILLMDGVDQMRRAADNMIDLIFNTNSSRQNESMKQLTLVTILFLPLNFLAGYFGMNFKDFTDFVASLQSCIIEGRRSEPEFANRHTEDAQFWREAFENADEERLALRARLAVHDSLAEENEHRDPTTPNAPNSRRKRKKPNPKNAVPSTWEEAWIEEKELSNPKLHAKSKNAANDLIDMRSNVEVDSIGNACLDSLFLLQHALGSNVPAPQKICSAAGLLLYSIRRLIRVASTTKDAAHNAIDQSPMRKLSTMIKHFPKVLAAMDHLAADRSLLAITVYNISELLRMMLTAIIETAKSAGHASLDLPSDLAATPRSNRSAKIRRLTRPPLERNGNAGRLCVLFLSMLKCLESNRNGHGEVLEGALSHLLKIVGQCLRWAMWGGDEFTASAQDDAVQDGGDSGLEVSPTDLQAQAPYLVWLLEEAVSVAARFPELTYFGDDVVAARFDDLKAQPHSLSRNLWIKLQHTLLKAVFNKEGEDDFEPSIGAKILPENLLPEIDCGSPSALDDSKMDFTSEIWRILGWDVLGLHVNSHWP